MEEDNLGMIIAICVSTGIAIGTSIATIIGFKKFRKEINSIKKDTNNELANIWLEVNRKSYRF